MLQRINDNAYKLELSGEYNISVTFNVTELSPFLDEENLDLRTNPFQEEGTDVCTNEDGDEQVQVLLGPVTCVRAKRFKESLQTLVRNVQDQQEVHENIEGLEVANQVIYTII